MGRAVRTRWIAVAAIALAAAGLVVAQRYGRRRGTENAPLAKTEAEKRILSVLEQARNAGEVYMQVPEESGRMMRRSRAHPMSLSAATPS